MPEILALLFKKQTEKNVSYKKYSYFAPKPMDLNPS